MKLYKILLFSIVLFGLYFYEASRMFPVETSIQSSIIYPLCILLVSILLKVQYGAIRNENIKKFSLFIWTSYLVVLLHSLFTPLPAKELFVSLMLPAIGVYLPYRFLSNGKNERVYMIGMLLVYCLLTVFYYYNYQHNIFINFDSQNNAAYTLLYFTPILLCSKYKLVRYIVLMATGVALLYSLKRSGLVAYIFALAAFLYVSFFVNESKKSKFIMLAVICIGAFGCYEFFQTFFGDRGDMLLDRFTQLNKGDSSGRDEIYKTTIAMIMNGGAFDWLFGHGYNSLSHLSPERLSAHNDYLEFLFDYGLFGFCALLLFVFLFSKYVYTLIKVRSNYAPSAIFAFVTILMNSFFSHVFFYEWYLLLISLFWGHINWATSEEMRAGC